MHVGVSRLIAVHGGYLHWQAVGRIALHRAASTTTAVRYDAFDYTAGRPSAMHVAAERCEAVLRIAGECCELQRMAVRRRQPRSLLPHRYAAHVAVLLSCAPRCSARLLVALHYSRCPCCSMHRIASVALQAALRHSSRAMFLQQT